MNHEPSNKPSSHSVPYAQMMYHTNPLSNPPNSDSSSDMSKESIFFQSDTFQIIHRHVLTDRIELLVLNTQTRTDANQHNLPHTYLTATPLHLQQPTSLNQCLPGDDAPTRQRFLQQWKIHQTRAVALPTTFLNTSHERSVTQHHSQSMGRVAGNDSSYLVTIFRRVTREMPTNPLQWMLTCSAMVVQSEDQQQALIRAFVKRILPIVKVILPTQNNQLEHMSLELATTLTKQFNHLPHTVFVIAGNKHLTVTQRAHRIATEVSVPIVVNMMLLAPLSTLGATITLTALTTGLFALAERPSTATDTLAHATSSYTLTAGTAFTTKLFASSLVPYGNTQFVAGTLHFMVASSLTSSVAHSTLFQNTNAEFKDYASGASLLHLLLEESKHHFTFLQYKHYIRKKIHHAQLTSTNLYNTIWKKRIQPYLPRQLHTLTDGAVASFKS